MHTARKGARASDLRRTRSQRAYEGLAVVEPVPATHAERQEVVQQCPVGNLSLEILRRPDGGRFFDQVAFKSVDASYQLLGYPAGQQVLLTCLPARRGSGP